MDKFNVTLTLKNSTVGSENKNVETLNKYHRKHYRVLLGMLLEVAVVGGWGSVPLRGRLGLLSSSRSSH